ncbi:MAG: HAMP domain-containing sensor histidine kinase [Myxococcota bacterium]
MSRRLPIAVVLLGAVPSVLLTAAGVAAGTTLGWPQLAVAAIGLTGIALSSSLAGLGIGAALVRRPPLPATDDPSAPEEADDEESTLVDALPVDNTASLALAVQDGLRCLAEQRWDELGVATAMLPPELRLPILEASEIWQEDRRTARDRVSRLRDGRDADNDERTRLLDALQKLTEELASSARARDAFLSRMSHELRTPLNAILGYAEMLEEDLEDPDFVSDVRRIRSSAANLLGTITAVLDLTQLESGQYDVVPQPLDVGAMAQEVGLAVTSEAQANGNTLEVRALPGIQALLDRRMLHSILFNLLSNACKYTRDGTVQLLVADVEDRLRIVVADTGIGMTQRQIEAAMTPFAQGDDSSTRRYDGSGLGLSVVHGFVEAMGGSLAIRSQPGEGASVEVELPKTCEARHATPVSAGHSIEDQPTIFAR